MASQMISVEVVYALPAQQFVVSLTVEEGTTAMQAAMQSGLAEKFALDLEGMKMGVYCRLLDGRTLPSPTEYPLQSNDRVEIYRPLTVDPKQARLLRAARARKRNI